MDCCRDSSKCSGKPVEKATGVDAKENTKSQCCAQKISLGSKATKETLTFNVGGKIFETYASTLQKDSSSLLSNKAFLQAHYREDKEEFFFDRDPDIFKSILNYMRTGKLHLPSYVCGPSVKHEFNYWGLSPKKIEQCCWLNYNDWNVTHEAILRLEHDRKVSLQSRGNCCEGNDQWNAGTWWRKKWQCKMWRFLNWPNSSNGARIYGIISLCFVLLSIFTFNAETTALFMTRRNQAESVPPQNRGVFQGNATVHEQMENQTAANIITETCLNTAPGCQQSKHPVILYVDLVCLLFFLTEYVIRFIFAPRKWHFALSFLSCIDLFAIIPDLTEQVMIIVNADLSDKLEILSLLNVLRIMRILRIFRLFRHVSGLWILIYTLRASFSELMMLLWFLFVGMLVFATLIYFAEGGDSFPSIPGGFWWAIVTMTTVGYGDAVPETDAGKVVGCFCAISGLLMIGFTVPSLVNSFTLYYRHIHYFVERNLKDEKRALQCKTANRCMSQDKSTLLGNEVVKGLKQCGVKVGNVDKVESDSTALQSELLTLLNPGCADRTCAETKICGDISNCGKQCGPKCC